MQAVATNSNRPGGSARTWVLRSVVWFVTAYTIITIIHEAAHAVTAVALGIPSTLFNFWVNHDFSHASAGERAAVGIAGPTVSLFVGVVCWFIYRRVRNSAAGLPLLYLAAIGVANFFGNLMSASFVGDFSAAAVVLGLSQTARYAASVTGAVALVAILFATGRELRQWTPEVGRIAVVLGAVTAPALVGTAIIIVVNQPTPMGSSFMTARLGEASFWLFAAFGALFRGQHQRADDACLGIGWLDASAATAAILAVRIMAHGIPLRP